MATTSPDNLFKPDGTSQAQLKVLLAQMQDSVQAALNNTVRPGLSVRVTSEADRDAKFPNPQQGDSVFRSDLGYVERYYRAYNATSNPGGRAVAGWAREGAMVSFASGSVTCSGSANSSMSPIFWTNPQQINFPSGRFTQPPQVIATANSLGITWCKIQNITATGFQIQFIRVGSTPDTSERASWAAIQVYAGAANG